MKKKDDRVVLRQSKEFARFMHLSGWIVEKTGNCYAFLRKIPLLPPLIMKIQYPAPPIPFAQIEKLAQKYHPLKIQIQPLKIEAGLEKYGYRPSNEAGHVTKTIQLNLAPSEAKIMKQMKKDARYGIRKAQKKGTEVQRCKDTKRFRQNWKKSVSWRRYMPSLKTLQNIQKAFGQNALFLTAIHYNTAQYYSDITAGTVILIADKTAYYYYAFTSKEGRENFAQYLLVWEAIREAKKRGCQTFDFEGIYDKRFPNKSWRGFSHFKKNFGGREVQYPGCWQKWLPNLKTREG
jgi:lipid II:glycine glycyltransferase (peptidoglycan interpeptide bridge formation enzyme)